ncbi:MAG: thioredoxin family protein [Marinoscillum sp.]
MQWLPAFLRDVGFSITFLLAIDLITSQHSDRAIEQCGIYKVQAMKTIKILGMGCPKCKQTASVVNTAIQSLGIEAEVIKVVDIRQIMEYHVLTTPAVVIDEQVIIKGRVPSVREITDALR